jgi:hypothetical protein
VKYHRNIVATGGRVVCFSNWLALRGYGERHQGQTPATYHTKAKTHVVVKRVLHLGIHRPFFQAFPDAGHGVIVASQLF